MSRTALEQRTAYSITSAELEALRAEVAALRRQVLAFQATRSSHAAPVAVSQLRERYEVLPPEAQALDEEAEADACATFARGPGSV